MFHRRVLLIALFATTTLLAASPSRAQDPRAMRHAALGAAAEADQQWERALAEYSQAFQIDSSSNYLLGRVVHCVFQLGRDDELMSLTRVLWKRDSTQDEAAADAGDMAFLHGRMDEAVEWFSAATRAKPAAPEHWLRLGLVFEHLNRMPEAEQALLSAGRADPDLPQALYHLGWLRARSGREKEALEPLKRLAKVAPDYPHGLIMLAQVQENTHQLEDARDTYARAAQVGEADDREEAQRGLARLAFMRGHPEEAISPLAGLVAAHPTDTGLRRLQVQALMRLRRQDEALTQLDTLVRLDGDNPAWPSMQAQIYGRLGQGDRARRAAERFREGHPQSYRAYEILGAVDLDQRDYAQALRDLDRAHQLAPDTASVVYLRGQVLAAAGRNQEAEQSFLQATRLDTTYEEAFFGLGVVRERMNQLDSSEAAFRRVLVLDPNNATARNYVGYMYADRGLKLEQSLNEINQALEQEPDNSAFLDSKGWVLYRLGRWDEARQGLEQALARGGSDPLIREHLGDVLTALKQYREAAAAYREALRQEPGNAGLKRKLHESEAHLR